MTQTDPIVNNPNPTVVTSALEELVGPGKKFQTVDDLAKGKKDSDAFINTLTNENKELRGLVTDLDKRLRKAESGLSILDRLNTPSNPQGNPLEPPVVNEPEPKVVGLSEEDVVRVVEQVKQNDVATRNKAEVDATLARLLGNEAKGFIIQKANELGMDSRELAGLALKSPKAFYNMLGINPNAKTGNTMYVNSNGASAPSNEPVRNNAFYESLKKKMGTKAFILDKNLQNQRHRDMETLGDAWDS